MKNVGTLSFKILQFLALIRKSFTAKGISEEDFDAFIDVLSESDEIEITTVNTDNNPAIRNQYHLKGKYDAKVSIIFIIMGLYFYREL
ncbi:type II toxin-antitoxin system RnlA family toxin [Bacteroides ovatus]|nr:type II toxin-antitoxin system RnlA family toxin [Bacteroides ovatus]